MKKSGLFLAVILLFVVSALPAVAYDENAPVSVRRSILIKGEHQRYIPFPFNVPSVNCGTLEVREFKRSYPFFGQKASYETKFAGERVGAGWYQFKITGADLASCAPIIDISAEIPQWQANYASGGFLEVEPEDLALFVKGELVPNNVFNLSTDDRQFSYDLVAMGLGTERTLDSFKKNTHFFFDTGDDAIVGAIIADSRGFLIRKVMFAKEQVNIPPKGFLRNIWARIVPEKNNEQQVSPSDIVVREGDIVVLIRKESF